MTLDFEAEAKTLKSNQSSSRPRLRPWAQGRDRSQYFGLETSLSSRLHLTALDYTLIMQQRWEQVYD